MTAWNACLLPWMSDAMATRMLGVIVYSVLKRLRLPVSIVAALVVAEAAVLIMRPRGGIEPVDAEPQTYFSAAFIERAEDFRSGQLLLFGVRMALEIGLLVYVVRRPPARLKGPFRRPVLAGAATAVALSAAVTVITLPVSAIARERRQGRRAGDAGLDRLGRRRRQGHGDRGRAGRRRRRGAGVRHAALRPPLVGAGERRSWSPSASS